MMRIDSADLAARYGMATPRAEGAREVEPDKDADDRGAARATQTRWAGWADPELGKKVNILA